MKTPTLLTACCLFIPLTAWSTPAPTYLQGKLANGLAYHIIQTAEAGKRLAIRLQIAAGTSDEQRPSEKGMAHMVEHMVFQSSPLYPKGLSTTLSQEGWQIGRHFNALTTHDFSRYILTPPHGNGQLDESLDILAHILLPHDFQAEEWKKEQQVILGEWRTRTSLAERLAQKRTASIRSGSREARYRPIGDEQAIKQATAETLSQFHDTWFAPNNAVLIIVSSLDAQTVARKIEQHLGKLPAHPLPARDAEAYEPALRHGWHIDRLEEADNSDNQLNLIFRFRNPAHQADDERSEYERLTDNFAAYIINRRLQTATWPASVQKASLSLNNIGRQSGAVGFYLQIAPAAHHEALLALLQFRQTVLAQPASDTEIADYRRIFSNSLRQAQAQAELPAQPEELLKQIDDSILRGKSLRTPAAQQARLRQQLYLINSQAVNARIKQWLNADDKLLQSLTAAGHHDNLPPLASLPKLADNPSLADNKPSTATTPRKTTAKPAGKVPPTNSPLTTESTAGTVLSTSYEPEANTAVFKLSNGDTAVALKTAAAGDQAYLKIISPTGYLQSNVVPWQADLSARLVGSSPPAGFSSNQFEQWKQQYGLRLQYRISSDHQYYDGSSPVSALPRLLQLYRTYQSRQQADSRWASALAGEAQRLPIYQRSLPGRQEAAEFTIRYGQTEYPQADSTAIQNLAADTLLRQWQLLQRTPVQYYIVSNLSPDSLKPLLEKQLAGIPRTPQSNTPFEPLNGSLLQHQPIGSDGQTDISAWSWQPFYHWTPETSEQIPLLVNLANARLKNTLRGEMAGVYSLKFTAKPNPQYNRVENELAFNSDPARAEALWQAAQHILRELPENITKTEADNLQQLFVEQEKRRRQDPKIWLERLAVSYQQYGDARYLVRLPELKYSIIQTRLRQTAKLLWAPQNARILFLDPAKEKRP